MEDVLTLQAARVGALSILSNIERQLAELAVSAAPGTTKRQMSAAGRRAIAAAQRERWRKQRADGRKVGRAAR